MACSFGNFRYARRLDEVQRPREQPVRLSSAAEHPYGSAKYGSRYQGQRGPTPSRSYANFQRTQI